MVAANAMLDVITGTSSPDGNQLPLDEQLRIANELVAGMLDEHARIEAMDSFGPRNKCRRFLSGPNAEAFRKMHEQWLAGAEALLARLESIRQAGNELPRAQELHGAVLSTRCLLKITIEGVERGMEEIRRGEFVTLEEGRRELRARAGK